MSSESSRTNPLAAFGQNEWLVDELYQKYLQDPESVDRAWWNFFADYTSDSGSGRAAPTGAAPAAPATPPPAAAPVTPAPAPASPAPKAAAPAAAPADKPKQETQLPAGAEEVRLRGAAARTAANMEASLVVPTATSVRAVPAKLLIDNRIVINNHLSRGRGGKVSFTHLIGYAVVRALKSLPEMNHSYTEADGKPVLVKPEHVNLGLAIDVAKSDGTRQLLVPSIKSTEDMDFRQFWVAYEDVVRKARSGKLGVDDFSGTTISLTNPGTIGTVHSVPRLMPGQGTIIGVGAMEYPAEYQGASPDTLSRLAVSKVMTLTSTYDHRIIQGAQSGDFLRQIHRLLLGEDGFYDEIFEALRIPYEPIRWVQDISTTHDDDVAKSARVIELIHAFRVRGHLMADTDPLEYKQRKHPDLDIKSHGLTLWDLEREFATGGFGGRPLMKLREILGVLRDSYCRTIGVEYMHMQNPEERAWIQARVERPHAKPDREEQLRVLERLNTAEAFETFLQTKFVGQKRFSLEGGESLIPLLDSVLSAAAEEDLDEAVIGMAHRGRLNVLANIVGKSYGQIFGEFEGNIDPRSAHGSGDVKYHLGASGDFVSPDGSKLKASVVANPSHLETVDPVLEGVVRAKQDLLERGEEGFSVLPVLVHGDAAFAGQGVVAETLNLSQLRGYRTGGSVHIVVNNQVGFTTSPASSRSSVYATDVARMIQAPIFHVNGDDPEAVVRVGKLAFEYRQAFRKDVVIDLICYRRRGHNEADNPSFTQPLMYDLIDAKRSTRKLYTEALIGRGDITVEEAESALRDYQAKLENAFAATREVAKETTGEFTRPIDVDNVPWSHEDTPTGISEETVKRIVETQLNLPEGFTVHPRLLPVIQRRGQMVAEDRVDWGMGETLAFGSLLIDGHPVRLVGQDSRRGTFVQRHAVLVDRITGEEHTPLKTFNEGTTKFYVYDSLLSEYAALGFEYGYSVERPDALVAWEAQFGDFVNGAQSVIDEYITAGEQKWGQRSGVTLLLPHGYEGQGPDHSSARIERFLQMCAYDNMTVAQPTLPANYFHLLRWQTKSNRHRPLVVFTPKSLLRHKAAVSAVSEFTSGSFRPVLGDTTVNPAEVRKIVLCSGKIYYDLAAARDKQGRTDVAIVRMERLYPFPANPLAAELARYGAGAELVWAQDEPLNMGPWPFLALKLTENPDAFGGRRISRVSRKANSSPATGSHSAHEAELQQMLGEIFN
ncbi:multifunctional oxoglutarate decarboxylase/oxoglutarate dehydrogenase thiamine pyrophosphate-binding subunit/dihydrolipoyllysine-residue succinyltransferase subunit [Streptosporangium sp. NBC_01639]|uniref:multifunctional oxoglutarate decarboxylase/oxoglutarate dehydrogenase thiamine pyrophosphate-binding subunit/dihydrolipoyllysine-residue succinyltransferase subunit n=1 Tax=unclassified Streptosporangium TaxID=2632669 RepID=UPI002DDA3DE1|nr:multifunctional oxoglutarate decarboxylase/oxoglutarate dehydrogenase thiamine pyrophosphate-binding subunit/dihydrolipoyllysine-residue succinyltransferase subunit [Streptosporangium sp. NBC_01756]WSC89077.1 multifunctional oxoglutarate decarboxylase/oxoglutarate dehydrogenase thiamine pyrophosphate-binding subunit/dihydrolipoyllysine-residue succinyltransferase subunit [Streptosporangium sp. NBC_01756]WTD52244.1 multifunctional oxoglutarate decarboxylase/oxoglutarate dehydrogenase thiamine p